MDIVSQACREGLQESVEEERRDMAKDEVELIENGEVNVRKKRKRRARTVLEDIVGEVVFEVSRAVAQKRVKKIRKNSVKIMVLEEIVEEVVFEGARDVAQKRLKKMRKRSVKKKAVCMEKEVERKLYMEQLWMDEVLQDIVEEVVSEEAGGAAQNRVKKLREDSWKMEAECVKKEVDSENREEVSMAQMSKAQENMEFSFDESEEENDPPFEVTPGHRSHHGAQLKGQLTSASTQRFGKAGLILCEQKEQCPLKECSVNLKQLPPHPRVANPELMKDQLTAPSETNRSPVPQDAGRRRMRCPKEGCSKVCLRIDTHINRFHKIPRGTKEFHRLVAQAEVHIEEVVGARQKQQLAEEGVVNRYASFLRGRGSGTELKTSNIGTILCGVRLFLAPIQNVVGGYDWDRLHLLTGIGAKGGLLDKLLENPRYKPGSIKVFLYHFIDFCKWAHMAEGLPTNFDPKVASTLVEKGDKWKKLLQPRINQAKVASLTMEEKQIEPWMVVQFKKSVLVKRALQRLRKGGTFSNPTLYRDLLMCLILLDQVKRAGDVAHITVKSIQSEIAHCQKLVSEGKPVPHDHIISVANYWTASSGEVSYINLKDQLWPAIKGYLKHIRGLFVKGASQQYLFTTKKGDALSPTTLAKCNKRARMEYWGDRVPSKLPPFTACLNRKRMRIPTVRGQVLKYENMYGITDLSVLMHPPWNWCLQLQLGRQYHNQKSVLRQLPANCMELLPICCAILCRHIIRLGREQHR